MSSDLGLELLAIVLLIAANGFFALSEFSIIASRHSRLKQKIAQGKFGAEKAEKLHLNPDRFLATIQVGITAVGTLAGVVGGATIVDKLESVLRTSDAQFIANGATAISVAAVAVAITVAAVILGELVPKYLALSNPERFARYIAVPIDIFIKLTSFVAVILSGTARLVLWPFGTGRTVDKPVISEEEINLIIYEGKKKGVFEEIEERLIKSVFDFADSTARRAMTPRPDVVAVDLNSTSEDVIETVVEHGYSRYPVYDQTIDRIAGVLFTKDLIHQKLNPELIILKDLIRKPMFVPDSLPLATLLQEFQRKKQQFAVVLDEFGGTAGIITLEDVLEELVGEIQDEDEEKAQPLVKHSETVAYADGAVWPGAVNELMNSNLPEDKVDTLAGLVIDFLGRVPEKNETADIADMRITILEQQDNRLTRLKLEKIPQPTAD
ncbi:MAG: hemolysin family protein [Candidatus Zixiibacteriota bacterium]